MKTTIRIVILLFPTLCLLGCSSYSSRQQRAVTGAAIAVVIVGSAIHASSKREKNLVEQGSPPRQ
jgi:hypothetical protein